VVEAEFGRPSIRSLAGSLPTGSSASLAQVHAARLPDGDPVVVKVQRPGIETLVETDCGPSAPRPVAETLQAGEPRVDLDRLYDEFSRTTRCELDFVAEGHNAEHFAQDFSGIQASASPASIGRRPLAGC